MSSCSAGGTDVGCDCAEFGCGCGDGAGVAGDPTEEEATAGIDDESPKELREYVEAPPPPCGVPWEGVVPVLPVNVALAAKCLCFGILVSVVVVVVVEEVVVLL